MIGKKYWNIVNLNTFSILIHSIKNICQHFSFIWVFLLFCFLFSFCLPSLLKKKKIEGNYVSWKEKAYRRNLNVLSKMWIKIWYLKNFAIFLLFDDFRDQQEKTLFSTEMEKYKNNFKNINPLPFFQVPHDLEWNSHLI